MAAFTKEFTVSTSGKGTYEITREVVSAVAESGIDEGQVTVFVQHTSASLVIMENADFSAREDLHEFFERTVPENLPYLVHTYEGPDDSTSHIRMVLTDVQKVIPIVRGKPALGTWQGIMLFEHRTAPHRRKIVVSVVG